MFRNNDCNIICSCMCSCICGMQDHHLVRNQQLDKNAREFKNIVNILLLGAAETGKSTLMRQMRIIHNGEMSPASLRPYKKDVLKNVLTCIKALIVAVHSSNTTWSSQELDKSAETIMMINQSHWGLEEGMYPHLPPEHTKMISDLWQDEASQQCWHNSNRSNLPESSSYYLSSVDRMSVEPFIPSQEDVIRLRIPTSATTVNDFSNGDWIFRITDIGGQRGSRRRWVRLFDGINAIIFLAALSEYDQQWRGDDDEEDGKNRLELSMEIFREVLRYPGFDKTSFMLFLNKSDVLEQKILKSDLAIHFTDYQGPPRDPQGAKDFIRDQFLAIAEEEAKTIHVHETCATDTQKTKFVFAAVRDDILWRIVRDFVEPFSVME